MTAKVFAYNLTSCFQQSTSCLATSRENFATHGCRDTHYLLSFLFDSLIAFPTLLPYVLTILNFIREDGGSPGSYTFFHRTYSCWFKYYFLLFQTHYHTLPYPETEENKFKPRIKLNHNINKRNVPHSLKGRIA